VPHDPSFALLLQLWQELPPEARQAAIRYMASLLGDEDVAAG
jgi:hypothetical protein